MLKKHLLLILALLLTGCFEGKYKVQLHQDGSVDVTQQLTVSEEMMQMTGQGADENLFRGSVDQLTQEGWKVQLQGNNSYTATLRIKEPGWDFATFTGGKTDLLNDQNFKIDRKGNWFVEQYRVELNTGDPDPSASDPTTQALLEGDMGPKFFFQLETPFAAKNSNATEVKGKELTWKLSFTQRNDLFAEFQVVRWDRILMLVGAVVLVLLIGVVLRRKPGRPAV